MFIFANILLCCIFIVKRTGADKVVSVEVGNDRNERSDRNTFIADEKVRRTLGVAEETEWQVSHLRDVDFSPRRKGCKPETFEEKINRYRRTLRNDGALVEYVSADALSVKETDKDKIKDTESDMCYMPDPVKKVFKTRVVKKIKGDKNTTNSTATATHGAVKIEVKNVKANGTTEEPKKQIADTGTTHSDGRKHKQSNAEVRRGTEYQFSSIEYYDESIEFDISTCNGAVLEVILELEHIREYDVQCQLLIEWRSLDSINKSED